MKTSQDHPETILVVEDNDLLREIVFEFLSRKGYSVLAAASGEQALATAAALGHPVDLLITDSVMPEMSGAALVDLLKPHCVIFISGHDERRAFAVAGTNQAKPVFLQKPFTEAEMLRTVRETLDRSIS